MACSSVLTASQTSYPAPPFQGWSLEGRTSSSSHPRRGVGNLGAFTSPVTDVFPQLLAGLSVAGDTLGSKALLCLKGILGNEVVFSVPSARAGGLGLLSLANVSTLTLGPSRRGSADLRDTARNMHLLGDDSAQEKTLLFPSGMDTLIQCKMAFSPPLDAICRLGRIPNAPDRLPHLRHLHLGVCELERRSDDGSESPHVALRHRESDGQRQMLLRPDVTKHRDGRGGPSSLDLSASPHR